MGDTRKQDQRQVQKNSEHLNKSNYFNALTNRYYNTTFFLRFFALFHAISLKTRRGSTRCISISKTRNGYRIRIPCPMRFQNSKRPLKLAVIPLRKPCPVQAAPRQPCNLRNQSNQRLPHGGNLLHKGLHLELIEKPVGPITCSVVA